MKKTWLWVGFLALCALGFALTGVAEESENPEPDFENTALLVIDVQAFNNPGQRM